MSADARTIRLEQIELGSPRLREFVRVAWKLHRGDPYWTPPLDADLLGSKLLGTKGLLTAEHPYHGHAEVTHWIAWRGDEPVGRISASIDRFFNEFHGTNLGFFGFYDCIEDAGVSAVLLDAARAWIAERGMDAMRGPGEYGNATHERQAVLVDGFDTPPTVDLTHNPRYYGPQLEAYGLRKVMDYHAYHLDVQAPVPARVHAIANAVRARHPEVTTRVADISRLQEELRLVVHIYNEAWSANWGFLPISDEEADAVADALKPIIDPQLVRFAYVDGEPAAVFGAFPDPNYALRPRWKWYGDSDLVRIARLFAVRRHIPRVRLMFFGIRPDYRKMGIDVLLYDELSAYAQPKGYQECDISMLLETNDLILRASDSMGATCYKTWRIYEMPVR